MTPLIEEFNATNDKNIYIDFQVYADNYSQMLDLAFSTNTAPDVYQLAGTDPIEVVVKEKGQFFRTSPLTWMTNTERVLAKALLWKASTRWGTASIRWP